MPTSWTNEGNSTITTDGNALTCSTLTATGNITGSHFIAGSQAIAGISSAATLICTGNLTTMGATNLVTANCSGLLTATAGIKLGNNIIYASDGGTAITVDTSNDVTIGRYLTVTGNKIYSSSAQVMTLSGSTCTFISNATITGQFSCNVQSNAAAPNWTVSNKTGTSRALDANGALADIGDRLAQLVDDLISIGLLQ